MTTGFGFFFLLQKTEDLVSDSVVDLLAGGFLKSNGQRPCEAHRDDEVLTSRKNPLHFFRAKEKSPIFYIQSPVKIVADVVLTMHTEVMRC